MVVSLYVELAHIEPEQFEAKIEKMDLDLFDSLKVEYPSHWINIAKFILLAFSFDSDMLKLNDDWEISKKKIYSKVGLPKEEELYATIVELKSSSIYQTVNNYLNLQQAREFKHLTALKELYEQMLSSIYKPDVDYDQKRKNSKYAFELWGEIETYEQRAAQKYGNGFAERKKEAETMIKSSMGQTKKNTGATLEDAIL